MPTEWSAAIVSSSPSSPPTLLCSFYSITLVFTSSTAILELRALIIDNRESSVIQRSQQGKDRGGIKVQNGK